MWFMSQPVINVALPPSELENNLRLMGTGRVKVSKDKMKQQRSKSFLQGTFECYETV